MPVNHFLMIRNTGGVLQYVLRASAEKSVTGQEAGFMDLSCSLKVNDISQLTFELDAESDVGLDIAANGHRWIVEFWRSDSSHSIANTKEFVGFILKREFKEDGTNAILLVTCWSAEWYLKKRHVLYHPQVANRSAFSSVVAETIMKTIVDYNCCANATVANSRWRVGTITGFSVAADTAAGNVISWECHALNVLETVRALADVAGGDFNVTQDATPNEFTFNWYTGQLGTDKSSTVVFDVQRGNVRDMLYVNDRTEEKTVCAVLGPKTGASTRDYTIRTGADYVLTTNDIEMIQEAQGDADAATRNATGDAALAENEQRKEFDFSADVNEGTIYRADVVLGDLVTGKYKTFIEETLQIVGVQFDLDENGEDIKYAFSTV